MEFSLDQGDARFRIEAYNQGCITINGEPHYHSVLIMPDRLISPWRPNSVSELTSEDFQPLFPNLPQLVLLGTGLDQKFPDPNIFADLYENNVGIEIMDTAAACRTYTLLMAEGRQVAAGLIIEGKLA